MKVKKPFVRPFVLQEVTLLPGTPILQGSVSDNTTVISMGQQVEYKEFDDYENFNHNWE
ncbi:MAG: hypothetical protein IKO29_04725 [Bacteroidales bacterium]|nr:hypothetical protein [Bacteroidales bacterium]